MLVLRWEILVISSVNDEHFFQKSKIIFNNAYHFSILVFIFYKFVYLPESTVVFETFGN